MSIFKVLQEKASQLGRSLTEQEKNEALNSYMGEQKNPKSAMPSRVTAMSKDENRQEIKGLIGLQYEFDTLDIPKNLVVKNYESSNKNVLEKLINDNIEKLTDIKYVMPFTDAEGYTLGFIFEQNKHEFVVLNDFVSKFMLDNGCYIEGYDRNIGLTVKGYNYNYDFGIEMFSNYEDYIDKLSNYCNLNIINKKIISSSITSNNVDILYLSLDKQSTISIDEFRDKINMNRIGDSLYLRVEEFTPFTNIHKKAGAFIYSQVQLDGMFRSSIDGRLQNFMLNHNLYIQGREGKKGIGLIVDCCNNNGMNEGILDIKEFNNVKEYIDSIRINLQRIL